MGARRVRSGCGADPGSHQDKPRKPRPARRLGLPFPPPVLAARGSGRVTQDSSTARAPRDRDRGLRSYRVLGIRAARRNGLLRQGAWVPESPTREHMSKVLGMLVALAIFAAVPAVAFGQDNASHNHQSGHIDQSASAGSGGNAGNQGAIVQQNAGRDANAAVNQQQNFSTGGANVTGRGGDFRGHGHGGRNFGQGGGVGVRNFGVGGVTLARTGFEAWALALMGGLSVAGGLGLLVAQRRRAGLSA